jgi:hypothetical protein
MASGIPKRAGNVKRKEKRAASWKRGQEAKEARKAEQEKREAHNRKVGTTGKQRANAATKQAKAIDSALANSAAGNVTDLGDFTKYAEQEDLLEI